MMIIKRSIYLWGIIIWALFLSACFPGPIATFKIDLKNNRELWGGYEYGASYVLNYDMFLRESSKFTEKPLLKNSKLLVPPKEIKKGGLYAAPSSTDAYKTASGNWPHIIGIVTEGTKIRCDKIIKVVPLGHGSTIYVYASIVDGPYKDAFVEISDLSFFGEKQPSGLRLKYPNSELISIVNKE